MADWVPYRTIKKRQLVNFTGNGNVNLSSLFEGLGLENAGVFTLNRGLILSTNGCNYKTTVSTVGTTAIATSQMEVWDTTPTLWHVDVDGSRNKPLYLNGYHTTQIIPSGYVMYTLEVSCKDKWILYENDNPVELQGTSGTVATPAKYVRFFYSSTATELRLRINATNVTWAYISVARYFTKTTKDVSNTMVIMEGINADGTGITVPPREEPQATSLGSFAHNGLFFEFTSITDLSTGIVPTHDYNGGKIDFFYPKNENSYPYIQRFTIPRINSLLNNELYLPDTMANLSFLQIGNSDNPCDIPIKYYLPLYLSGSTTIYQYTTGGINVGSSINRGSGVIEYIIV